MVKAIKFYKKLDRIIYLQNSDYYLNYYYLKKNSYLKNVLFFSKKLIHTLKYSFKYSKKLVPQSGPNPNSNWKGRSQFRSRSQELEPRVLTLKTKEPAKIGGNPWDLTRGLVTTIVNSNKCMLVATIVN